LTILYGIIYHQLFCDYLVIIKTLISQTKTTTKSKINSSLL